MRKVIVFTGRAGTGKTTALMDTLAELVQQRTWASHETVLALTFMHGSRRRLESKLKFLKRDFKIKSQCSTIDSLAVIMVNKFRCYLQIEKSIKVNIDQVKIETQYEVQLPLTEIQQHFVSLLNLQSVIDFISNTYPFLVIDEFQDCTGNLLEIIQHLSTVTTMLIAADPFQQLSNDENSEGMAWILANDFDHRNLDEGGIRRTKNDAILNTAACLRTGTNIPGKKIYIAMSVSKYVTAANILPNIYYHIGKGSIAIISPVRKSKFITDAMNCLANTHTFKSGGHQGRVAGPYDHLLSSEESLDVAALIAQVPKEPLNKEQISKLKINNGFVLKKIAESLFRKLSLRNVQVISYQEFCSIAGQVVHTYENFYQSEKKDRLVFTTIHGAKNREFETVIILWPYEVAGSLVYKRKLLYNAITRAKHAAIIIVQRGNLKSEEMAKDELFGLIYDLPK